MKSMLPPSMSCSSSSESAESSPIRRSESLPKSYITSSARFASDSRKSCSVKSAAKSSPLTKDQRNWMMRRYFDNMMTQSRRNSVGHRQRDFRKKQKVHRTFVQLSQLLLLVVIGAVVYFDVMMVVPHLTSIFWAIVWAIILAKPREALLAFHARVGSACECFRPRIMVAIVLIYTVAVSASSVFSAMVWTLSFILAVFILYGDRHTVVAAALLVSMLVFIAIPIGILLKSSVEEMDDMIRRATDFIAKNPEVQKMIDDFGSSSLYLWCVKYVKSWGYDMPQWDADKFKEQAVNALSWVGNNVVVLYSASINVVSTTGRFMMSFVTFLSFLFYLLKQPGDSLFSFMDGLSPFSEHDTARLLESAKRSLSRACVCSLMIGALHMAVTFLTCRVGGLEFTTILSVLSGVFSMLPIISSWIVWVPVSLGLYFSGARLHGAGLALTHILVELYLDPLILSFIPGNAYLVGLAVVTGCYVFGPGGVLTGPLLAGFSATVLDMYRDYITTDWVLASDPDTPSPPESPDASPRRRPRR